MKSLFAVLCCFWVCLPLYAQKQYWGVTAEGGNSNNGVIFHTDSNGNNQVVKHHFFKHEGENAQTGAMVQASDGKLYGMAGEGGRYDFGVLFQYDISSGTYSKKVDFDGSNNGRFPYGTLVAGPNGKLYGLTSQGGINNMGVLFEYDLATSVLVKKIDFDGTVNGSFPLGALVLATDGKFYGMTSQGGTTNDGVLFQYDPITSILTPKLELSWSTSGSSPQGSLMQAADGNLYGLTRRGGAFGNGAIIRYNPSTTVLTRMYDFTVSANGYYPVGTMIQATNGKLYGMTQNGGSGVGVVFQVDLVALSYTAIATFDGVAKGSTPYGSLVQASDGLIYGMTYNGGTSNRGVLFRVDPGTYTFTKIVDFNNTSTGNYPKGTLMQASNGKLYGLTSQYAYVYGGLFELDPVSLAFTRKFDFGTSPNGGRPLGSLMQAKNGKLFGLAEGGTNQAGVIFQYDLQQGAYSVKHHFAGINRSFSGTLVEVGNGELYGVSFYSELPSGKGTLFSYNYITGVYTERIQFNGTNGSSPIGSLLLANDGKLYGMTYYGGTSSKGVLFQYDPGTNVLTKKIDFGGINGETPNGSLIQASDGMLYGLTSEGGSSATGVLFQYNPVTSIFVKKADLSGTTGQEPYGSLVQSADGNLYGMTTRGGNSNTGVIFQYNPITSVYSAKASFDAVTGGNPYGSLLQASNGKLYGMTNIKGGYFGTLFQYDPTTSGIALKFDFAGPNGASPLYTHLIEVERATLTTSVSLSPVCPGTAISVPYSKTFTNQSGNVFSVQLSNASGSFTNPVNIGSITSTTTGTINATIPFNTPPGTGYRIRVISSSPIVVGSDNGTDIMVKAKPKSGFTINQATQCLNTNQFVFTDTTTVSSGSYTRIWYAGMSDTSTNITLTKTFSVMGNYTIRLITTSNEGCVDSISRTVAVNPNPKAGFTMSDSAACVNGNVFTFTDTSSFASGSLTRKWSLGQDTSTAVAPVKTFMTAGLHMIKLVSSTNVGCKDSISQWVNVYPKPLVGFTVNQSAQCFNTHQFVFQDTSSISSGTYMSLWNMNGVDTSGIMLNKVFNDTGNYVIRLFAQSNYGCRDSMIQSVKVNPNPRAAFVVNQNEQCINGNLFVFADTTVLLNGAHSRTWSFGNGDTASAQSVQKSFLSTGVFPVKLVVRSAQNCSDSLSSQVSVNPKPMVGFVMSDTALCLAGNQVLLSDTSSISSGTKTRIWYVEHDTVSAQTINKQFSNAGNYPIKLLVTSDKGCRDSVTKMITLYPAPVAGFSLNKREQCLNNNHFTLTDISTLSGGSYTRTWRLQADTFYGTVVNKVFNATGNYPVKLFLISDKGCTDSALQTVMVNPNPSAGFTMNDSVQCLDDNLFEFEDTTTVQGGSVSRIWNIGFEDTDTSVVVERGFMSAGKYSIQLTVTNAFGCKDSVVKKSVVLPMPDAGVTQNRDTLTANEQDASYQWFDCATGQPIQGATAATFIATRDGFYQVKVQKQGCVEYSICLSVLTSGFKETVSYSSGLSIYPNPSQATVTIESTQSGSYQIVDALGKSIRQFLLDASNNYRIQIETLADGVYFIIGLEDVSVKSKLVIAR